MAWLEDAPDVEKVLAADDPSSQEELITYIDKTVTTINPAILPDGSNVSDTPLPKTNPHVCNKSYTEVEDHHQDLCDLVATCQRHTRCSAAYCLRTKHGVQKCDLPPGSGDKTMYGGPDKGFCSKYQGVPAGRKLKSHLDSE